MSENLRSFATALTLAEYRKLTLAETAEIVNSEYGDTGKGTDPIDAEYGFLADI